MTAFRQLTAQRREQRRYEKRMREQAMAVYRYQVKLAQDQAAAVYGELASDAIDSMNRLDRNRLN